MRLIGNGKRVRHDRAGGSRSAAVLAAVVASVLLAAAGPLPGAVSLARGTNEDLSTDEGARAVPPTGSAFPPWETPEELRGSPAYRVMDEALAAIAMTRADLSFRTDYADELDAFRLAVVDRLLERPLETEVYVGLFADRACGARSMNELVRICARDLDLLPRLPGRPVVPETMEPKGPGPQPLDVLLPAFEEAIRELRSAFAGLSEEERRFVALNAPVLLEEDEFDPDKPIDERDIEAEEDEQLGDELLHIAALVDYEAIASAGSIVARAVELAARIAEQDPTGLPRAHGSDVRTPVDGAGPATGDVWNVIESEVGLVVLGGPGRTVYLEPAALIIDVGGDDEYRTQAGAAMRDLPVSVVIDLSGDDVYSAGHHAFGSGFMGVGAVFDLSGNDTYSAGDFSIGSGLFGVGMLLDRDGNDSYTGDTCTQGAGAFGIGILRDETGNDSYRAALFSQAFGFVKGVGLLHDVAGNDSYSAGQKYTDEIRYFDHYISLSQGFGFGWRPDASGGVGMLVEQSGNDVYVSDIFGQGSSYWFAVGGLVDYGGNDNYVSYQYAQGAGTHITVAALLDYEGDDNYVSKGVSQGCGHDLAIGILHDLEGDDNYACHDLSQAAGNANGIGVLIDDLGDDSYSVRNPDNTHGYGNLRRDYGSVGVFLDCGGRDDYSGRGGDGQWWTYSHYGVGVDTGPEEKGAGE